MGEGVMYFDPLALVFLPSAAVIVGALVAPVAVLRRTFWVRRARKRNGGGNCGRCGASFGSEGEVFVYSGVFVCEPCAERFRRGLAIALPALGVIVLIGAALSITGFVLGGPWAGGPSLSWWFGTSRWIPLIIPSVGLGTAGWLVVRAVKRENRLAQREAMSELLGEEEPGRLLPTGDQ